MLTREQKKILELLKEIDIICRKNKITYFLSPYFTLCAVTGRPFPMNPMTGAVYMKPADMERFKNAFEEEPGLRRALDPGIIISIFRIFTFGIRIKIPCFTGWMITENISIPEWR